MPPTHRFAPLIRLTAKFPRVKLWVHNGLGSEDEVVTMREDTEPRRAMPHRAIFGAFDRTTYTYSLLTESNLDFAV